MKIRQLLLIVVISSVSSIGSVVLYHKVFATRDTVITRINDKASVQYARFSGGSEASSEPADFTKAARLSAPAVVHIKTKTPAKKMSSNHNDTDNFFNRFFGVDMGAVPEQRESGSGVIISSEGYIITNNHVISDEDDGLATEINVTVYNGKTYRAKLIGRDKATDIAVLRIEAPNLPYLVCGNSDDLQAGQWVLAVGYPLSLETTVTAGIISATGRGIGMNSRQVKNGDTSFRSFIQTDAAMNMGSSGGALVNMNGELIGINSTIVSPTGTYAGYSFAIPINTVKKTVKNIIQSAKVPRGLQ